MSPCFARIKADTAPWRKGSYLWNIRLSPPLVIDDDQAAEMLRILRKVFLAL